MGGIGAHLLVLVWIGDRLPLESVFRQDEGDRLRGKAERAGPT